MELTDDQVHAYEERGFLFIPDLLSSAEVEQLREGLPAIFAMKNGPIVRESDGSVRLVFGVHQLDEGFGRLIHHPAILNPSIQLLRGDVYVHQSKIVKKAPQAGDGFPWHQDYVFWKKRDRVPSDNLLSVIVFLDEVTAVNGPIFVVAGSHTLGFVGEDTYAIKANTIPQFCPACPIEVPVGPAGSVMFLHSMVIHGSPPNISPLDRTLGFVTFNRVDNAPPIFDGQQPEFISSRSHEPVTPFDSGALRG